MQMTKVKHERGSPDLFTNEIFVSPFYRLICDAQAFSLFILCAAPLLSPDSPLSAVVLQNIPNPSQLPFLTKKAFLFLRCFDSRMTSTQQSKRMASLDVLDEERAQTVRRALMNILTTELAEFTYAQILDGLPTQQAILDSCQWIHDHPACQLKHEKLCDGFLEKAREFRSRFDPSTLVFGKDVSTPSPSPYSCSLGNCLC